MSELHGYIHPIRAGNSARITGPLSRPGVGAIRSSVVDGESSTAGATVSAMDATSVRNWADECVHSLRALRAEIDGINVYPVADSDTGSNMLSTLLGARDALTAEIPTDRASSSQRDGGVTGAGHALRIFTGGAVRSAHGNSGVILAQVLRGLAESLGDETVCDAHGIARALHHADTVATAAVASPVEGTILTVLHAAADAVRESESVDLLATTDAAAKAAAHALEHTTHQLPVLQRSGVVDAGGRGLAAVLDALVATVSGAYPAGRAVPEPSSHARGEATTQVPAWEVMYLLDELARADLPALRGRLAALGESVSVAEDGSGTHAVHVHCADIGAALEAGMVFGTPHRVRVEPLTPSRPGAVAGPPRARGVIAVLRDNPLADIIGREGIGVLRVAPDMRLNAEELLGLIVETATEHVTVLPGDAELTAVADDVTGQVSLGGRDVVVVPCVSPVQVLAALAVHDSGRRMGDDVVAMAEAAAATRRGELRVAGEESLTWVGTAHAGAIVGFVDEEVVLIDEESSWHERLLGAATRVLERMLSPGGELVTVLTGAAAPEAVVAALEEWTGRTHPEVEFVCYSAGQEESVLLIGVE